MNTSKQWLAIVIGSGLAILVLVGILTVAPAFAQGPGGMMGGYGSMMQGWTGSTPLASVLVG